MRETFAGGLHGIEHAMIGIMPFHVMCDRWDMGGVSTPSHPDTNKPTVFIYDGFEGGIGLSEKAFELITEIVKTTYELVKDCKCEDGCPACIYSPKCGNENKPLDKKGTMLILKELLSMMGIEDVTILTPAFVRQRITQYKRFAYAHPNFCSAKTSFMPGTLYAMPKR